MARSIEPLTFSPLQAMISILVVLGPQMEDAEAVRERAHRRFFSASP